MKSLIDLNTKLLKIQIKINNIIDTFINEYDKNMISIL